VVQRRNDSKRNVRVFEGSEVSALLEGHPVGMGRELWQAGLLSPSIVGEDRVLARGTGGAASVRVAGGILVQRHRQLQVLLQTHTDGIYERGLDTLARTQSYICLWISSISHPHTDKWLKYQVNTTFYHVAFGSDSNTRM
jgi:hypothetical protein